MGAALHLERAVALHQVLRLGSAAGRLAEHLEPGGRTPERTRHVQCIAGARAGTRQHLPPLRGPDHGDVNHQGTWRAREVAADDVQFVPVRQVREAGYQCVEVVAKQGGGQHRTGGQPRGRAHGREVAQVDRQRPVPNRGGRREAAVEMDTLHNSIDAENLQPVPLGLDNGRIIANADCQPAGRRLQPFSNAPDELALCEVGDSHW